MLYLGEYGTIGDMLRVMCDDADSIKVWSRDIIQYYDKRDLLSNVENVLLLASQFAMGKKEGWFRVTEYSIGFTLFTKKPRYHRGFCRYYLKKDDHSYKVWRDDY